MVNPDVADVAGALPTAVPQDATWVLTTAFLAFLSIFGFALLAVGSVRYKSTQSAVITVLLTSVLTILVWWLFGYAFAFGADYKNGFIGASKFGAQGFEVDEFRNDYDNFIFHAVGALTVGIIFAFGSLERAKFLALSIQVLFITGFFYPVVAHWTFAQGWLNKLGYKDFAGSGVIHYFGGVAALAAAFYIGKRKDYHDQYHIFQHHSPLYIGLGSLVLVFSWIALISGFTKAGEEAQYTQALVAVNAIVAASAGGLGAFTINYLRSQKTALIVISRGAVAGLIAISASANTVYPWAAALIGVFGAITYLAVQLGLQGKIDDPTQAIALHFGAGFIGIVLLGIFDYKAGLFYGFGATQLGVQLAGVASILGWGILIQLLIIPIKGFGLLRVSAETEHLGIDQSYAGGEGIVFRDEASEPVLLSSSKKAAIFR